MSGRFLALAAAGLLALTAQAAARETPAFHDDPPRAEARAPEPIQLAQVRQAEIYYDQYGRQVLVDRQTGEVLGIRDHDGVFRPAERQTLLEPPPPRYEYGDRYERPGDVIARERRERRLRELGRGGFPPPAGRAPTYRDYRAWPGQPYPEYDDDWYDDDFAEEPWYEDDYVREEPWRGEQPARLPERDRVERQPLDEGSAVAAIPDPAERDTIVEEAPPALPDPAAQPEPPASGPSEDQARIQVLLDRVGASPGVIDGRIGDNVNKAIAAYRDITGERLRTYDADYVEAQLQATGGDAFKSYEITALDAAGPFVASIPEDYGEKARMERLGFTSVAEMLAERFHMDERYLRTLNPGVDFNRPGTILRVANVGTPRTGKVARIVADKGAKQVRGYGEDGRLLVAYPATIGSTATPSPTGTHTVERIALDPEYTYNPRINFQQGDNTRVLTIPPGPNGPVGTVWIGLSKPTYGIHGTPEPSLIGRTNSNGCIRLTNWDAQELAKLVEPGVTVEFVE